MSQSRQTCPLCGRAPGTRHLPECARSRDAQRELAASLAKPPRLVWPAKGPVHASVPAESRIRGRYMKRVDTFNPGVPMVKPPKPWTAGGLPRGSALIAGVPAPDRRLAAHAFYQAFIGPIRGEVRA